MVKKKGKKTSTKKNQNSHKKHIFIVVIIIIGLIALGVFSLSLSNQSDEALAGDAIKNRFNTNMQQKSIADTPEPEAPIYQWVRDSSYQNKIQGGRIGEISKQGSAYFSTETILCPSNKLVVAINGISSDWAYENVWTSSYGNYPKNTDLAGLKLFCGKDIGSSSLLGSGNSDIVAVESWGKNSNSNIETIKYKPHDYPSWTVPILEPYADFNPGKGIRKLRATMVPDYFVTHFFTGLDAQLLEVDWDNSGDPDADLYYNWDTVVISHVEDLITSSNLWEDTVNCPSSTANRVYVMTGVKLYLTKIILHDEKIVQGVKIYCSRYNRVQTN